MRRKVPAAAFGSRTRRLKPRDIEKLVDRAIGSFKDALANASAKFSVGDLVRLVQLRKELGVDEPGRVTVRWVDECRETLNDE